jgi:hypothetical protein
MEELKKIEALLINASDLINEAISLNTDSANSKVLLSALTKTNDALSEIEYDVRQLNK